MKNTTKRIISILMSIIMLLSAIPVVFAAEDSLRETYLEEVTRLVTHTKNIYENDDDFRMHILSPVTNELSEKLGFDYLFAFSDEEWAVADKDDVAAAIEGMREVSSIIESKIVSGEATVIIDSSAVTKVVVRFIAHYNYKCSDEMVQHVENSELGISLENKIISDEDKLSDLISAGTCTQADYDELMASYVYYLELIMQHMDGEHDFNEYISNNDATEDADGTMTATCEFCGATDTVVDEGSRLTKEPASFIEKLIEFFRNFFAKIAALFA